MRRGKSALRAYAEILHAAEVNSSFYQFHRTETYRGWRREVPEGFEFTIKCHRSISHEARLRATEEALENMRRLVEAAEAYSAKVLVLQTPASLGAGGENLREAEKFFEKVERGKAALAWETRGESWDSEEARRMLREVLERYEVVHVTDPFKLEPVTFSRLVYFRLHGLPGYNLRYTYTNAQLLQLHELLQGYEKEAGQVYVFFNNYAMYRDAERLQALHRDGKLPPSPFGPRSVWWALHSFEDWPTTKEQLLSRCGRWRCWVEPTRSVELSTILRRFREHQYRELEEAIEEAERVWEETSYPTAEEVEMKLS
jgi:uncharacterized protein YecE (DUF72 family)